MSGLIGFTLSLFLFLSIAVLRVCIEDRRSFAESRRACTGEYRRFVGRGVYRRFAGSDVVGGVGRLSLVSFRFVAASVRVRPPASSCDWRSCGWMHVRMYGWWWGGSNYQETQTKWQPNHDIVWFSRLQFTTTKLCKVFSGCIKWFITIFNTCWPVQVGQSCWRGNLGRTGQCCHFVQWLSAAWM